MDLIRTSAINASARLQFARIAFGAAGSAGVQIDTGDAEYVARNYMKGEKPEFTWPGERAYLPKSQVKLLLNMILIANSSIPRGGNMDLVMENTTTEPVFTITVSGRMMRIPQRFQDFMDGRVGDEPIDAHSVQFYYALVLAREAGMKITIDMNDERIVYRIA